MRALRLIGFMPEEKVSHEDLHDILKEIFKAEPNILQTLASPDRSSLRKVIRMYDYLKWGKK